MIKVVILAAGQGIRLGDLTKDTPKCLIDVKGKSILEWELETLQALGIRGEDIFIVIGAKGACWTQASYWCIRDLVNQVLVNFENTSTHNTFSLAIALQEIQHGPILAIDGDLVFNQHVILRMLSSSRDTLIVSKLAEDKSEPGTKVVTEKDGRVVDIGKTITPLVFPWGIHNGMIRVGERFYNQFKSIVMSLDFKSKDMGHPLQAFCQAHELYNIELNAGWVNVNTQDDLALAKQVIGGKQ
jgi:choline kinase